MVFAESSNSGSVRSRDRPPGQLRRPPSARLRAGCHPSTELRTNGKGHSVFTIDWCRCSLLSRARTIQLLGPHSANCELSYAFARSFESHPGGSAKERVAVYFVRLYRHAGTRLSHGFHRFTSKCAMKLSCESAFVAMGLISAESQVSGEFTLRKPKIRAAVAQWIRASVFGTEGRGFESLQPYQSPRFELATRQ